MRHILTIIILLTMASYAGAAALPKAGACGSCHVENFREWESSAHSRSILSQEFRDALKKYLLKEGTDEGGFCFRCHAPELVISGDIFEATKMALKGKTPNGGVTCVVCHSVESVRDGKLIYDTADFSSYHRVKDLMSLDRAGLCTACHSVYRKNNAAMEGNRGFLMRHVSKIANLFAGKRGRKSNHSFSDATVAEKKGQGCPGINGDIGEGREDLGD